MDSDSVIRSGSASPCPSFMSSSGKERQQAEKELLEWELSLQSSDLRAHAWYHGNITRLDAEGLLQEEGEFLVRDSTSSGRPGDFALSCVWKGAILHFLIQKVSIKLFRFSRKAPQKYVILTKSYFYRMSFSPTRFTNSLATVSNPLAFPPFPT